MNGMIMKSLKKRRRKMNNTTTSNGNMTVGFYESKKLHRDKTCYNNVIRLTHSDGEYSEVSYHRNSDIYVVFERIFGLLVSSGFSQETVESAICEKAYMIQDMDEKQGNILKSFNEKQGQTLKNNIPLASEGIKHLSKKAKSHKSVISDFEKPTWAGYQLIRGSGLLEDICSHGVGHPNQMWLKEHIDEAHWGVHGCDGCCDDELYDTESIHNV